MLYSTTSRVLSPSFDSYLSPDPPPVPVACHDWSRVFEQELPARNLTSMSDCAVRYLAPALLFRPWSASSAPAKDKRRLPWDALKEVEKLQGTGRY